MAGRKRAGGLAAVLMAGALIASSPLAALADQPTPAPSSTVSTDTSGASARELAARIVALQRTAEEKGKVAEQAGEKANAAKAASDAAAQELTAATQAADDAAAHAAETRARASAVAAQLARTNFGTLPLDLMLNGRSAEGILGGLSTSSQLSVQSQLLFDQAKAQQIEAERLRGVADAAATDASAAADAAATAWTAAKKEAATAKTAVDAALAEQAGLLAQSGDDPAVCASVGSAPVAACLPSAGAGPKGASVGAKVVRYATAQIGKPYVFAAAGPDAYDCSGLTLAAYASAGVAIGTHSATNQYVTAKARHDLVPLADAKPGDLLFYTDGGGDMYHVTIYAGNGLMLEAPYPGATVRAAPVRTGDLVAQAAHFG
ncbi:C40 family peptidase [Amnibacterium kyonggiense]|uniref:Cell wall-associated NlpC family hydrolase n=1 Tax=Amnibacterium kyonggiense TaxID=595671 RepID=A0A4R7FJ84_9MICO|nr:C40 family peptidase [Amnibacterium kyonggiense]TDS76152.1 cell wall-associated NlpC family hydrolase [Amnibacterium kyonggiense]